MVKNKNLVWVVGIVAIVLFVGALIWMNNFGSDEVIKIGYIGPLTGAQSFIGEGIRQGLDLSVSELILQGKNIEVIYEDSQGEVMGAVSAYQKLLSANNPDLIILVGSGDEAISDMAGNDKVPLILTVSSASNLPSKNEYTFRYFTNADDDAPVMAEHAVNELGMKKIGVLYLLDSFGVSYNNVFSQKVSELGGQVVISESFQYSDYDYGTQLLKISQRDIDSIYIVGLDYQVMMALKKIKELGIDKGIITSGTIATQYSLQNSEGVAEGVHVTAFCTDGTPESFVTKFQNKYSSYPSFFAEIGYDIGKLIEEAMADSSDLKVGLNSIENLETNVGIVSVGSTGEFHIPMCAKRIEKDNRIFNLVTQRYSNY
jgi:branched-chain amino acid transport system substrate-binding protein